MLPRTWLVLPALFCALSVKTTIQKGQRQQSSAKNNELKAAQGNLRKKDGADLACTSLELCFSSSPANCNECILTRILVCHLPKSEP